MIKTKRFSFYRVFWVILALYTVLGLLTVVTIWVTPVTDKNLNWDHFINLKNLLSQAFSIAFSTVFYYFLLNNYYELIVKRKSVLDYLRPTLLALVALAVYYCVNHFFLSEKEMEVAVNKNK